MRTQERAALKGEAVSSGQLRARLQQPAWVGMSPPQDTNSTHRIFPRRTLSKGASAREGENHQQTAIADPVAMLYYVQPAR